MTHPYVRRGPKVGQNGGAAVATLALQRNVKPDILGLILSIKQQRVDTISVWHRTASSAEVKEQIRKVAYEVEAKAY